MPTGREVFEQLSWHWEAQLRPRWEGLTGDELHWQPVPDCWDLRAGTLDGSWPSPAPAPVTTIAWRIAHIGHCFHHRWQAHFGGRHFTDDVPDDVIGWVDEGYRLWSTSILAADEERMNRPHQGPPSTADQHYPLWAVVLHLNREVIHHGAEVALLRDLYLRRLP
ncbi:MAG: serine/arginine repetitive matrix protein 1 [Frankiales bacterium]|nr:serine/arginine repetitive matrix protein 1 [Frankiales bacterium]